VGDNNSRDMTARLLRAIAADLAQRVIPELKSADAIERATLSRMVALNLAADLDVVPGLASRSLPALAALLDLANKPSGEPAQDELTALRAMAATRLRGGASEAGGISSALQALGRWDAAWVLDFEAAMAARDAAPAQSDNASGNAVGETVVVENVSRYLQRVWPDEPGIRATEVIPIPGGRSKKTFFVSIEGSRRLPRDVVVRQDYALKYAGTKVAEEFKPLLALSAMGLPVPKPLHLEAGVSELGPPFILVNRLSGKAPGSYFSQAVNCPGAFRQLAAMLGQLHRVDPVSLGFAPAEPGNDYLLSLIHLYQGKWRDNATRPAPVVDYAYAWAARECAKAPGSAACVHGDSGPYNFLVDGDRLSALLDWEFAHVGDPAEDLGIARVYAESCMPWEEFLQIYRGAGGPDVPESRVQLGMLVQFLKGTTLTAASGRNFLEGATTELVKGATAFTGLRMIEARIARLLQRFGAA
jgi:aminoglycoside phosphotransferase (APT) family kinase protein